MKKWNKLKKKRRKKLKVWVMLMMMIKKYDENIKKYIG
jgi:hypothetical protein